MVMTTNRVHYQHFALSWRIRRAAFQVFSAVPNEIVNVARSVLESLRLRFQPLLIKRWSADVTAHEVVAIIGVARQRQNGQSIAVVKPNPNGGFQLRDCRQFLRNGNRIVGRLWLFDSSAAHDYLRNQVLPKALAEPHDKAKDDESPEEFADFLAGAVGYGLNNRVNIFLIEFHRSLVVHFLPHLRSRYQDFRRWRILNLFIGDAAEKPPEHNRRAAANSRAFLAGYCQTVFLK